MNNGAEAEALTNTIAALSDSDLKLIATYCTALLSQRESEAAAAAKPKPVLVDLARVRQTYSGRPGCCCGCRGKHRFASKYREGAQAARGYPISDDEVSDRSVDLTVRKINALIAGGADATYDPDYVSVDTMTRTYIAYFANAS
jgi:hypothetical protein